MTNLAICASCYIILRTPLWYSGKRAPGSLRRFLRRRHKVAASRDAILGRTTSTAGWQSPTGTKCHISWRFRKLWRVPSVCTAAALRNETPLERPTSFKPARYTPAINLRKTMLIICRAGCFTICVLHKVCALARSSWTFLPDIRETQFTFCLYSITENRV